MPSKDRGLDGVCNRSYPITAKRYMTLWKASLRAGIRMVRNHTTGNLECVWEGNHWGTEGVHIILGELPRERTITELRALRQASREGCDPLSLPYSRMKPPAIRRFKLLGGRCRSGEFIPSAFKARDTLAISTTP